MSFINVFINRPIGTSLLAVGMGIFGMVAYFFLPVAPLPQVEFPTIYVQAALPGASPEIMASSVATPLERQLGRISGVTDMTSASNLGSTNISIQFDLNRDINGAARDVQAAIIAARNNLPFNLPSQPTYRIVNPADSPILILTLVSDHYNAGKLYDIASTVLQQKISQADGVGQVIITGSSLSAVRINVNPGLLFQKGLGMPDIQKVIRQANVNLPKGQVHLTQNIFEISTNSCLFKAKDYEQLIVAYKNNEFTRLKDVAVVEDSVEDIKNAGIYNQKPAVFLIIFKKPGSNIIKTVDNISKDLPYLQKIIPQEIVLKKVMDRTTTIRSSLQHVQMTLLLATFLVVFMMYKFLGKARAAIIPSITVPLSLAGTFGIMYLCGYSLDNLSLMALTIATGFVVDDAIVVVENCSRHIENNISPIKAAFLGTKEVYSTVISMSLSLIAVFIPILLMGGLVGRLFREFALVLSIAILLSMFISLSITPMMTAYLLKNEAPLIKKRNILQYLKKAYEKTLYTVILKPKFMQIVTVGTIFLNIFLFWYIPKGFFPQQDSGRVMATIQANQNISFEALKEKLYKLAKIIQDDEDTEDVVGIIGGASSTSANTGRVYFNLKDLKTRHERSFEKIIERLRKKLKAVPGATLYMKVPQDLTIGGKQNNGLYQFRLSSYDLESLNYWTPKLLEEFSKIPGIVDVNSDQLNYGLQIYINLDRDRASVLGASIANTTNALYGAYGQGQISTMFGMTNQNHVVLNVEEKFWKDPTFLNQFYVQSKSGQSFPITSLIKFKTQPSSLIVNHQGELPVATLSFNLKPGYALGSAVEKIQEVLQKNNFDNANIQGTFQGTAQAFQKSLESEPYLILSALLAVYIVLGMLYESFIHPLTILATLPSAGVGALIALLLTGWDLNILALIGILLLIGIVKKNAIMMIDFALDIQRNQGKTPKEAIYEGCIMRFRAILMTTMTSLLSSVPLILSHGYGSELRQPLGIAIFGGLIVSQFLTLYTTPILYLFFENMRSQVKLFFQNFLKNIKYLINVKK